MNISEQLEEELRLLLHTKDPLVMTKLYDLYSPPLYGIIFRTLNGNVSASENILQLVFATIWRNSQEYDPEKGRLFTWIIGITRQQLIGLLNDDPGLQVSIQSDPLSRVLFGDCFPLHSYSHNMEKTMPSRPSLLKKLRSDFSRITDLNHRK